LEQSVACSPEWNPAWFPPAQSLLGVSRHRGVPRDDASENGGIGGLAYLAFGQVAESASDAGPLPCLPVRRAAMSISTTHSGCARTC